MKLALLKQSADAVKLCQTDKPSKRAANRSADAGAEPQGAAGPAGAQLRCCLFCSFLTFHEGHPSG